MNLDTLLDSTATVADPPDSAFEHGLKQLEMAAASSQQHPARGKRARHYGLLAAAAALVIAAAVLVPSLAGSSGSSAQAATVFREAARSAGQQPGGWPDAPYWHSVSTYQRDGKTFTREIWISHDGTSVLRDPGVDPGIMALGPETFPAGGSQFTWDQLYALPTDPTQLAGVLRRGIHGAGADDDSELFVIVGDLLRESPAPPSLRQALYEVAATVPGVTSVGTVVDRDGRTGQGLQRNDQLYVVDTSSGQLLQEESQGWVSTYESQGPATSAPAATTR